MLTHMAAILILSAPSGAGKTSLSRALVDSRDDIAITVSHTTREQRLGEIQGRDYYFVDNHKFESMIAAGSFIEYATVFGHYYGTSINAINELTSAGKHAILEIDWQGAKIVREKFPRSKSVFIMPPSLGALEERLRQRKRDSQEIIEERMKKAASEISHKDEFDVIIVNDDFDSALNELNELINSLDD